MTQAQRKIASGILLLVLVAALPFGCQWVAYHAPPWLAAGEDWGGTNIIVGFAGLILGLMLAAGAIYLVGSGFDDRLAERKREREIEKRLREAESLMRR